MANETNNIIIFNSVHFLCHSFPMDSWYGSLFLTQVGEAVGHKVVSTHMQNFANCSWKVAIKNKFQLMSSENRGPYRNLWSVKSITEEFPCLAVSLHMMLVSLVLVRKNGAR